LFGQQRNREDRRIYGGSHSNFISSHPSEETEKKLLFKLWFSFLALILRGKVSLYFFSYLYFLVPSFSSSTHPPNLMKALHHLPQQDQI
jgi:hypothetical protein